MAGFGTEPFGTTAFNGAATSPAVEVYDFSVAGTDPNAAPSSGYGSGGFGDGGFGGVSTTPPVVQIYDFSVTGTEKAAKVGMYVWTGTRFAPVDMYYWDGTKLVAPGNLYYAPLT